jgi:hypothetical protein
MNTPNEPLAREDQPQVNEQRRRLAKGGLAAPIVVGTLLSRPVLGAAPHNCTISGQLSGNVSTHEQGICSTLGVSPATWVDKESNLIRKNAQFAAVGFTDTYWAKNGSNKLITTEPCKQQGARGALLHSGNKTLVSGPVVPQHHLDLVLRAQNHRHSLMQIFWGHIENPLVAG